MAIKTEAGAVAARGAVATAETTLIARAVATMLLAGLMSSMLHIGVR